MAKTWRLPSILYLFVSLAWGGAALTFIAAINAAVVYIGLLPCGIGEGESSLCRDLTYYADVDGTRLITPHSWFYYPAHVLLLLPLLVAVGAFVAVDAVSSRRGARSVVYSAFGVFMLALVLAFFTALSFTRLAFTD